MCRDGRIRPSSKGEAERRENRFVILSEAGVRAKPDICAVAGSYEDDAAGVDARHF
jgi:hypothetical protein